MRNGSVWMILLVLLLALSLTFVACGDDDDDDDDNDVDDDITDDDTGDDDDTVDDDTADDDTADDDVVYECWDDQTVGEAVIFAQGLDGSEGIAFNSAGELYIATDLTVARLYADGTWEDVADFIDPIGLAFADNDDLYVAEFGANNLPGTDDGAVFKLSADFTKTQVADGIENPNYLTYTPQGTMLVSDNYTTTIFEVTPAGELSVWYDGVVSPNGMVYSRDRSALYVAGTFASGAPVYRIDLDADGNPTGHETIANLDTLGFPDGLALDENGLLYVTENALGRVVRLDPQTGDYEQLAAGIFPAASIAFGQGPDFDPCSIYVTELSGDKIWRIALGVRGTPLATANE